MKSRIKKGGIAVFFALLLCICALFTAIPNRVSASAQVRRNDLIHIQEYKVDMTVNEDRTVRVQERITVAFLQKGLTMFYRSLPKEDARYYDISASCNDGKAFEYNVKNNPDDSDFIDINCIGGAEKGSVRTYDIAFTMENGKNAGTKKNGMIIDVIPFGFTVDLHNVSAVVHFPFAVREQDCILYSGYGATTEDTTLNKKLSDDGKTLTFATELLPLARSQAFGEYVAKGVTVDFTFADGQFQGYMATRLFTDGLWRIVLFGVLCLIGAVVILQFTRTKRELVTTVNISAPDGMDPITMGKLLDGTANTEDITAMIYYFAEKGYLTIDLQDEKNPVFRKIADLPEDAPLHQKTLFNGLFKKGNNVSTIELQYRFFEYAEKAKMQVSAPKMYEKKSEGGFLLGGVLACLFAVGVMRKLTTIRLGRALTCLASFTFLIPIFAILVIGYIQENYRYKWKKRTHSAVRVGKVAIAVLFTLIFSFCLANHIFTEYEKLLICAFSFICLGVTSKTLSRTEDYLNTLGQILGFKDFIVYTEEDKIAVMLEENPQLYYKVLPYAQVLGVSNEWIHKFDRLVIPPPNWCSNSSMSAFDCWVLNRCMRSAFVMAMARPPQSNGGFVGKSGGGGRFGGFGGGGFGGGGGGAR